ncbi:hypothetical protein FSARC_5079 [Fusarium sarcochroum]|nr:hypothetical protein FSARC_5079 [Fusarium sarcochroum]
MCADETRQPAQETQHSNTASKPIEPLPGDSQSRWSEWILHNSGSYYYRARYISYKDISAISPTGRNSIVPNIRGGYIHYEFIGVNDAASQGSSSQAPELSACSTITTPTTSDPAVASQEAHDQKDDQLVVSGDFAKTDMLMSGALQTGTETLETVVVISNPNPLKRISATPKKQKDKKKHGKKLEVDKRKQVSNKAKVNKCASWPQASAGPDQPFSTSTRSSLTTKPRQFSRYTKLQLSLGLVYTRQHHNHTPAAIMTSTIGIPIKLLNEAQGHIVTLEITSGQTYRGKLLDAEDNMNVQLKDITVTARDGRVSHLDQVYIRGSHVRFFIVPDMLRNAPMFRSRNVRGRGVGLARGRATVSRARAGGRGGR